MKATIRLDGRAPLSVVARCTECPPWRSAGGHRLVLLEAARHLDLCHEDARGAADLRERAGRMQARHAGLHG